MSRNSPNSYNPMTPGRGPPDLQVLSSAMLRTAQHFRIGAPHTQDDHLTSRYWFLPCCVLQSYLWVVSLE